jgi:hypothetical protein
MSIAQAIILVAGIYIAVYQSQKLRESIDTTTWSSVAAQLTEVDKQFIDDPELVPYFYDGVSISESDPRYNKAYAVAGLVLDFLDNASGMGDHINPEIFEPDAWERYYSFQFKNSPLMCDIVRDEGAIYGKKIVSMGQKYCPRPESKQPK